MRAFTKNNNGLFAIPMDQTAGLICPTEAEKKIFTRRITNSRSIL
jgi:hypothetical protein